MPKPKPKRTRYAVTAYLQAEVTINIDADSFEDALAKSHELGVTDFVEVLGEHNDSSHTITSLFLTNGPYVEPR